MNKVAKTRPKIVDSFCRQLIIMMGHGLELTYGSKYGLRGMQDRLRIVENGF